MFTNTMDGLSYVLNVSALKMKLNEPNAFCERLVLSWLIKLLVVGGHKQNLQLYHTLEILSREDVAQNLLFIFPEFCATFQLAFWVKVCYNLKCQGEMETTAPKVRE